MLKRKPQAPLGASLVVLSSFFYASYGIWTKLLDNSLGGYTASAIRSVLVMVMLVPIAVVGRKFSPIAWSKNSHYIIGMLFSSMFTWGPLFYAVLHAGVGIALTINYAGIIIGMFMFGWMLVGESYTRDKFVSTVLSFVGLWLVFTPSVAHLGWLSLAAAVVSGLSAGANGVMAKKLTYNATQSTVVMWAVSVIANAVMAGLIQEHVPTLSGIQWLYLVGFAAASVASSWSFVSGLKLIDAGAAGILGLLEIVFGVLFGVVLFGERIGIFVWLGVMVIIAAAAIPYVRDFNVIKGSLEN